MVTAKSHKAVRRLKRPVAQMSQNTVYITFIIVIVLINFVLTSTQWHAADPAEGLFFLELKGLAPVVHQNFTVKLYSLAAGLINYTGLWPLRLISALCALAVSLSSYAAAKKLYDADTGFLAALVLLTLPLFTRFAVSGLPYMYFAALTSLAAAVWLTAGTRAGIVFWRWAVVWLCAVLALLSFGLTGLYAILIFIFSNFVVSRAKRQPFFNGRAALVFVLALAAALMVLSAGSYLLTGETMFSLRRIALSLNGISDILSLLKVQTWSQPLPAALGVWFLALVAIGLYLAILGLQDKFTWPPNMNLIGFWFLAVFIPALVWDYDPPGKFVAVLPPVAVFIAFYLNRYAQYKNRQFGSRRGFKKTGAALKWGLLAWGLILCLIALTLFFYLELAWLAGFYLQTRQLALLFFTGLFVCALSQRGFWLASRAYTLWAFVVIVALSLNFIGGAVLRPARDVLRSPAYFSQNFKALFPQALTGDFALAVSNAEEGLTALRRYFLYAGYSVPLVPVPPEGLAKSAALPRYVVADSHGEALQAAGYRPVYWEEVDGHLVTVFDNSPPQNAVSKTGLVLAAADEALAQNPFLAPGYCRVARYLVPYGNHRAASVPATAVTDYPQYNLRLFTANMGRGMYRAHAFRWLLTAPGAYGKNCSGLVLYSPTARFSGRLPYGESFQKWAMHEISLKHPGAFMVFAGYDPHDRATRRTLELLTGAAASRQMAVQNPMQKVRALHNHDKTFLQFLQNSKPQITLEIRPR